MKETTLTVTSDHVWDTSILGEVSDVELDGESLIKGQKLDSKVNQVLETANEVKKNGIKRAETFRKQHEDTRELIAKQNGEWGSWTKAQVFKLQAIVCALLILTLSIALATGYILAHMQAEHGKILNEVIELKRLIEK